MADLHEGHAPAWPGPVAAWSAVLVLLIAYAVGYVDRAILTIVVEPIQADLHINDTQLSLLHGFAFVIFYVTLGVPLGYLADRTQRKWLVVGSIALWSVMTAACGFTRSFSQLFAARVGVGFGEAGLSPASYSMIADYFPPEKRAAPLGVYTIGIYLGSGLAILGGGLVLSLIGAHRSVVVPGLGDVRSWQLVFMIVGAPGLLVAALAATIREPPRRLAPADASRGGVLAEFSATLDHIRRDGRVYGLLTLGFAFLGVPFNVALLWARPYLTRHFGVAPALGSTLLGLAMVVFATAGIVCGSVLCDAMTARGHANATVRTGVIGAICVLPPVIALPLAPTLPLALASLAALLFFAAFAYGAAPAALQLITPNRKRATVSALYLLLVNLVGLTAGPVLTGVLTDYVFHESGAVGYSAAIVAAAASVLALSAFVAVLKPFTVAATRDQATNLEGAA